MNAKGKTKENKTDKQELSNNKQDNIVRKSKIALAMEELKGNPAIRILDMRAVLR